MNWFKRGGKSECAGCNAVKAAQHQAALCAEDVIRAKEEFHGALEQIQQLRRELRQAQQERQTAEERHERLAEALLLPISRQPASREEMLARVPAPDEPGLQVVLAIIEGVFQSAADALAGPATESERAMGQQESGELAITRRGELRACRRIKGVLDALWSELDERREQSARRSEAARERQQGARE
jgi:hypothetical protein